jgi:2-oxoglutarate dehydrogenase E1 component
MISPNEAFEYELYFEYLKDPQSVSQSWRDYFSQKYGNNNFLNQDIKKETVGTNKFHQEIVQQQNIKNNDFAPKSGTNYKVKEYEIAEPLPTVLARVAENMDESLSVPTATSYRTIPVKALEENRRIINNHLDRNHRKKVSFTHIISWAIVRALIRFPNMNSAYVVINQKPHRLIRKSVNYGVAVDMTRRDGTRILLVPNIKDADKITFAQFVEEYDSLVEKTRNNKLDVADLMDTTVSLTNPGMIGTTYSAPRLMKGQGLIVGIGAIEYPPELQSLNPAALSNLAVSKVVTLSSTYDHRIIQGAESAEFLAYLHKLITGGDKFYEQIFYSMDVPYEPFYWSIDNSAFFSNKDDYPEKTSHVMQLINAFRVRGHLLASTNPLGRAVYFYPELDPSYYGFTIWDLDRVFHVDDVWEKNEMKLRDVLELLKDSYCNQSSIEFMHIQDFERKEWIKKYFENTRSNYNIPRDEQIELFKKIAKSEIFENFLHTKFIGTKRFSLEGGETLITLIDKLLNNSTENDISQVVLGMAHRGRLNVVANNLGKELTQIFKEFEGDLENDSYVGSGDVKYHLGYSGKFKSKSNKELAVLLAANPSHLEIVNPVVEGMAKAFIDKFYNGDFNKVLPILVHGDSSFSGQGIVMETLNLSELEGYRTGGTIHIVVNNQIGFTTTSEESRSTYYSTDVAKILQAPILHVNGNNPEAVAWVADFAFKYRQTFHSDIVIDLLCYRKYGHNESDEPTYTQPLLYKKIRAMQPISRVYAQQLLQAKVITNNEIENTYSSIFKEIEDTFNNYKSNKKESNIQIFPVKKEVLLSNNNMPSINKEILQEITDKITKYPNRFNVNPKIKTLLEKRRQMIFNDRSAIDWSMAEALAFGIILLENKDVRLSGQDSRRGTFSQRHSVLIDSTNEDIFIPLNHIRENQGKFTVFDSPLSEYSVLGFEYGYSVIATNGLTLWEAQFGDFANNAIPIVDQYLSCGESKWGQFSNLVMLLPHSYDGQGPEHSSARPERYLQLCAEENMLVANISTPANYFHALRRQLYLNKQVPLIIFTPKGLLRHPLAISKLEDFTDEQFKPIIDDLTIAEPNNIKKIIFHTGKIYYELLTERNKKQIINTALIRIEQLYPLDKETISKILKKYSNAVELIWFQEEPKNQGYWNYIAQEFTEITGINKQIKYFGRPASPATATGSSKIHIAEQSFILENVFK